jgi:hypothetical protein
LRPAITKAKVYRPAIKLSQDVIPLAHSSNSNNYPILAVKFGRGFLIHTGMNLDEEREYKLLLDIITRLCLTGYETGHNMIFGISYFAMALCIDLAAYYSSQMRDDSRNITYTTGEHSVFTKYLLQGLKGKTESIDNEGNVTPESLGNYADREIMNLPLDKRPRQRPITRAEGSADIILASYPQLKPLKVGRKVLMS